MLRTCFYLAAALLLIAPSVPRTGSAAPAPDTPAARSTLAASGLMGSPRVPDGTYRVKNHPDGGAAEPFYCLRLDKLFGNHKTITFDCEHPDSDVTMVVSGSTITISGVVFGGKDAGTIYDPNESGLWQLDFTFTNAMTAPEDDDLVVPPATPSNGSGTIIPLFSTTSGTLTEGTVFNLIDYAGGHPFTFRLGDRADDGGHRGYNGISGWGWIKFCEGETCTDFERPDIMDWLFTAEAICADKEAPFWDGNITENGDGTGMLVVEAPNGLKLIEVGNPSHNLVLVDVRDMSDNSLVGPDGFVGSGFVDGTHHDGYTAFTFAGSNEFAPKQVKLLIAAPEDGTSSFFLHLSDCCDKTLRVDPQLSLYGTSVDTETLEAPGTFVLEQNYPNPFNPQTTIRFALPEATEARLVVLDVLGREVRTLSQGILPAGSHEVQWDGRSATGTPVPSGLYFYRLETPDFAQTRRMLLIK